MNIGTLIMIVLAISLCWTLYKKNYNSATGIGIMLFAYILIRKTIEM